MPFLSDIRAMILAGVAAILAITCAVLYVEANGLFWIDGLKDQIADCARDRNELRAIAKAKDEQRAETSRRIEQADKGNREADTVARRIEEAPVAPNCATPPEVLQADI